MKFRRLNGAHRPRPGQFCYAYNKIGDLDGSIHWNKCTPSKIYGCCPQVLVLA